MLTAIHVAEEVCFTVAHRQVVKPDLGHAHQAGMYEVDPLACLQCGGRMKVVAFIEPPPRDVIEKILHHCGLWRTSAPRPPPDPDGFFDNQMPSSDEPRELTCVDIDTFLATF